jgi:GST-like protein
MEVKRELDVTAGWRITTTSQATTTALPTFATWPWYGALALGELYEAGEFLQSTHIRKRATLGE